jgi:hypothetical protein
MIGCYPFGLFFKTQITGYFMSKSQSKTKIPGLVLIVAGLGLAFWGYQMSGSLSSQVNQAFNGSYTDKVMIVYIAGAASFIAGLFLLVKK